LHRVPSRRDTAENKKLAIGIFRTKNRIALTYYEDFLFSVEFGFISYNLLYFEYSLGFQVEKRVTKTFMDLLAKI